MRTTLAIDDDVFEAARGLALRDRKSIGQVMSELARKGLAAPPQPRRYRNGVPLMPVRPGASRATMGLVNRLRDDEA